MPYSLFKRFPTIGTIVISIICVLVLPGPRTTLATEIVRTGGTGTALGVLKLLAEAYERTHPGVKITIVPSLGSSGGINAVMHGALTCAISSRPLKEEEKKGATAVLFARSPFVFAMSSTNKKSNITTTELEKIYSGETKTWSDGSRIRLILRPATETDTRILTNISPAMQKAIAAKLAQPGTTVALTDQDNADMLFSTPGGIGATTLTQIRTEKRVFTTLSFNGVQPTVAALADNTYPLSKPLYLVTSVKTSAAESGFAAFILTDEGCSILRKAGNVCKEGTGSLK